MALKCQNTKKINFPCCAPLSSGDLPLSYNLYISFFFFPFLPLSDVVNKFSLIPREGKKASKQHREQVQLLLSRWWYEDSVGGCKHRGQCYLLLPVINAIVCLPFTQLADVLIWLFHFHPSSVMRREPPIRFISRDHLSWRKQETSHRPRAGRENVTVPR